MSRAEKKNLVTVSLTNIVILALYAFLTLATFHNEADAGFAAVMRIICMFMLVFSIPTMLKIFKQALVG